MQCHKCKYDARNGGTQEQRQEHCLSCNFSEIYSAPAFPIHDPLTEKILARDAVKSYESNPCPLPAGDDGDEGAGGAGAGYGDAPDAAIASSEFVQRFCRLSWRSQQIVLGLINCGDNNAAVHAMTRMAVSTIIEHRRKLEADPYWSGLLSRLAIRRHVRRRRSRRPPARRAHDCNGVLRRTSQKGSGGEVSSKDRLTKSENYERSTH